MSPAQEGSIEFQVEVLSKQALGQNIILILDDIWDKGQPLWRNLLQVKKTFYISLAERRCRGG